MIKAKRRQLAKSELLMYLATTAERWKREIADLDDKTIPFAEWPADDVFVTLCRTYELTPVDLAGLCDQIGNELENRAIRAGYEDHWDAQ